MIGYAVRCRLPLEELGRLDLPKGRLRYQNGWVRRSVTKDEVVAVLEDREGSLILMATPDEARNEALIMGHVICLQLQAHTGYEYEPTGDHTQVRVAL